MGAFLMSGTFNTGSMSRVLADLLHNFNMCGGALLALGLLGDFACVLLSSCMVALLYYQAESWTALINCFKIGDDANESTLAGPGMYLLLLLLFSRRGLGHLSLDYLLGGQRPAKKTGSVGGGDDDETFADWTVERIQSASPAEARLLIRKLEQKKAKLEQDRLAKQD